MLFQSVVEACQYLPRPTNQNITSADYIFIGTPISVKSIPASGKMPRRKIFTLRVDESFKGNLPAEIKIFSTHNGLCGGWDVYFSLGEKFLVFGHMKQASTWLNGREAVFYGLSKSTDMIITTEEYFGTETLFYAEKERILEEVKNFATPKIPLQ